MFKPQNMYDVDLTIIPEIVDSAIAHFLMGQVLEPMELQISIVPEYRNRRKMMIIMGEKEIIQIKCFRPCICKRQCVEEQQRRRIHMAFEQIRKRWREIHPEFMDTQCKTATSYVSDNPTQPGSESSTSTAHPIDAAFYLHKTLFNY